MSVAYIPRQTTAGKLAIAPPIRSGGLLSPSVQPGAGTTAGSALGSGGAARTLPKGGQQRH